jgi:hypothetical protein
VVVKYKLLPLGRLLSVARSVQVLDPLFQPLPSVFFDEFGNFVTAFFMDMLDEALYRIEFSFFYQSQGMKWVPRRLHRMAQSVRHDTFFVPGSMVKAVIDFQLSGDRARNGETMCIDRVGYSDLLTFD